MKAAWAIVLLVAGCDWAFSLDRAVDRDRDGIPDAEDNCPSTANPDQTNTDGAATGDACECRRAATSHDEDADGIDDACDNCPHVANAEQLNTDGDQVGDACEGEADTLECIALFDPFVTLPASVRSIGAWTLEGDRLAQTDATLKRSIFLFDLTVTSPRVEIAFETRGGTMTQSGGVWLGVDLVTETEHPELPLGLSTMVTQLDDSPDAILASSKVVTTEDSDSQELARLALGPATVFAPPSRALLSARVVGQTLTARANVDDSTAEFGVRVESGTGGVGLRTVRMAAAYDYVFVADRVDALPCP